MDTLKKFFPFGMRTVKTALVVFLGLTIAHLRGSTMPIHAAMAAAFCIRVTRADTFRTAIDRVVDTSIGAVFGFTLVGVTRLIPLLGTEPYKAALVGLGVLPVIGFTQWENKTRSTFFTMVVFISIALSGNAAMAFNRLLDTAIGCVIGTVVNMLIAAPADPSPAAAPAPKPAEPPSEPAPDEPAPDGSPAAPAV